MEQGLELNRYLKQLEQLVNIDCGSHSPEGIAQVANLLTPLFEELGFAVTRHQFDDKAGPCLEITNKPGATEYDVMLCGHMDTVFPEGTVASRPMTTDAKKAYGPGVSDMKSGILSAWYALSSLSETERERLSIVITLNCDEEIGSVYSRNWLEGIARKSRQVLVCEAARACGNLIRSRKGNAKYELEFHGVASHAGSALAEGVSAIYELAQWSLAIKEMVNLETGTTLNVGVIEGGVAVNVVPEYAKAIVDLRFWDTDEADVIHQRLQKMAETPFEKGARVRVNRLAFKPSMRPTSDTQSLIALVSDEADKLGLSYGWEDAGGGSDGNFTAAIGTPTLDGFGPLGAGFHSDKEYLILDSIEPRIILLANVLRRLSAS
ncbi:M20 family metallopeptidase [Dongshaea marina]|uniref:M20 family metallopeptidase n=1 Tax=Dongshaea marina TaxID=2047966 RepID=UPI000D3E2BDC|nr:M20 family metallopeptidase [Dongshaea marina]